MEKLGSRVEAILLDMIAPAPKGEYCKERGHAPDRRRVYRLDYRGKTVVFSKDKRRILSGEILDQIPDLVPQTTRWKPGWFAGWWYISGRTPEVDDS